MVVPPFWTGWLVIHGCQYCYFEDCPFSILCSSNDLFVVMSGFTFRSSLVCFRITPCLISALRHFVHSLWILRLFSLSVKNADICEELDWTWSLLQFGLSNTLIQSASLCTWESFSVFCVFKHWAVFVVVLVVGGQA